MFSNPGAQVNQLDPTALLRAWGLHTVQRFPWVPSPSHFHNIIKSSYTFFHTTHRFPWVPSPPSSLLNSSSNTSLIIIIILNNNTFILLRHHLSSDPQYPKYPQFPSTTMSITIPPRRWLSSKRAFYKRSTVQKKEIE